jgi:hypothetical protein
MALKPNGILCHMREQVLEDLPVGIKKYIGPEIINDFQSRIKWLTECNCPIEAAFGFQS